MPLEMMRQQLLDDSQGISPFESKKRVSDFCLNFETRRSRKEGETWLFWMATNWLQKHDKRGLVDLFMGIFSWLNSTKSRKFVSTF